MDDCRNCAPKTIPYISHEASMARMEAQCKRLWIALIVSVCMLFASNVAWVVYESQFDTVAYTQDGEGTNIIGNLNEVDNGAEIED